MLLADDANPHGVCACVRVPPVLLSSLDWQIPRKQRLMFKMLDRMQNGSAAGGKRKEGGLDNGDADQGTEKKNKKRVGCGAGSMGGWRWVAATAAAEGRAR